MLLEDCGLYQPFNGIIIIARLRLLSAASSLSAVPYISRSLILTHMENLSWPPCWAWHAWLAYSFSFRGSSPFWLCLLLGRSSYVFIKIICLYRIWLLLADFLSSASPSSVGWSSFFLIGHAIVLFWIIFLCFCGGLSLCSPEIYDKLYRQLTD